jgi:hypothetical protein
MGGNAKWAKSTRRGRRVVAAVAVMGLFLGMTALTPPVSAAGGSPLPNNPRTGLRPQQMPKTNAIHDAAAPAGAHLTYYGGKVISNVQVTQVLYGAGTYTPEVSGTGAQSIAAFYAGVTNSAYLDWLSEYDTTINAANGQPGTQQHIGRGTFVSQKQIIPAAGNNGATVDDVNIQAELRAQINAGVLPMPNANTLLAVYFRANQTITQGGSASGVQFCAYHGTVAASGNIPEFYYSVLPDFTTGGMTSGCGSGTRYQNETSVSSHELVEAVTDAEVGLATVLAPPLAWYDNTNGEIGDICNGQQATVAGGDGVTYTVQNEFSNHFNNCIATAPVTNDFSIAASPNAVSVAAGSSGTSTISTAVTAGAAQSVSLSASGLPAGASASFSPTSVTAGSSSTLTLRTTAATAPGTYPITVTGTGASATHTTSVSFTVTAGTPTNDFSIAVSPASASVTAGSGAATTVNTATTSGSAQTVSFSATGVPSGATAAFSPGSVTSGTSATLTVSTSAATAAGTYAITVTGTGSSATHGTTFSLTVTNPSGGGVTNGGFETGNLSGWTATGTEAVTTATPHSGSYADQGGTTTPTNGDSSIVQTFTVPSGFAQVSFWYKMTCPDTVTYDWAIATLKDNSTGTTTTVLPKTCATNSAYVQKGAAVTIGHSYTLTLTSHDDNYATDPSFTRFDDVTLVAAPPPKALTNGGFETGNLSSWTPTGTESATTATPRSGAYADQSGTSTPTNGDSSIAQSFTAPAGSSTLSFWYKMTCPDTVTYDWATATLRDNTTGTTTTVLPKTCATNSTYLQKTTALIAGHNYTLTLTSHDDNYATDPSFTRFDDVVIT